MGLSLPGSLTAALGFIGGSVTFPEGDEDALIEMGRAYDSAAFALQAAGVEVGRGSADLQQVIEGEVHLAMAKYFDDIAGPDGLAGVAENFSRCGTLCDLTAVSVIIAKEAYIATLAIFAAELIAAIAASPLTFGASMGVAAAEGVVTGVMLRMIIRELVENITRHIVETGLKTIARKAVVEIATSAGIGAATGATKELVTEIVASGFFGDGVDPTKILIAGGKSGASEAASAGAEGLLKSGARGPRSHGDGGATNGGSGTRSDGDGGGHPSNGPEGDGAGPPTSRPSTSHPSDTTPDGPGRGADGTVAPHASGRAPATPRSGTPTPSTPSPRPGDSARPGPTGPRAPVGPQPVPGEPPRATASPGGSGSTASEGSPQARSQNSAAPSHPEIDTPEDVLAGLGGARTGDAVSAALADDPSSSVGDSTLPSPGVSSSGVADAVIRDRGYQSPASPGDRWEGRDLDPGIRVTPPAAQDGMVEPGRPVPADDFSAYTESMRASPAPAHDPEEPPAIGHGMYGTITAPRLNLDTSDIDGEGRPA